MAEGGCSDQEKQARHLLVVDQILAKLQSIGVLLSAKQIARIRAVGSDELATVYGNIVGCEYPKKAMQFVIEAVNRHEEKHFDADSSD